MLHRRSAISPRSYAFLIFLPYSVLSYRKQHGKSNTVCLPILPPQTEIIPPVDSENLQSFHLSIHKNYHTEPCTSALQ